MSNINKCNICNIELEDEKINVNSCDNKDKNIDDNDNDNDDSDIKNNIKYNLRSYLGHTVKLKCGHCFHYWCIKKWYIKIKKNNCKIGMGKYIERQCPYCRKPGGLLHLPDYDGEFIQCINTRKKI